MRQNDEIDAGIGKRQKVRINQQPCPGICFTTPDTSGQQRLLRGTTQAERHAVGAQKIMLRQTQLHGIKAENISHQMIVTRLLPVEDILSLWCIQPGIERTESAVCHNLVEPVTRHDSIA